jgi:hypothetical protein
MAVTNGLKRAVYEARDYLPTGSSASGLTV